MKSLRLILIAALAFTGVPALAETVTGSGTAATDNRPVAGFHSVGLSVSGRLEIVQGDAEKLSITADDNILPLIEATVDRGELRIRFREGGNLNIRPRTPIRMTLNAKALDGIAIAGSGDVQAPALNARELKVSIAGSGDVMLAGKAQELSVKIAGSGDVKAGRFESQSAQVHISGSGDATVWAREKLNVHVSGSGDVRYYGDPGVQSSVAGSGSVRRLGATPG